ncbi:ATP-binding protein [Brachybacterium kimchii]|uniref:ATP-binding protein n=1 Tax=Brachybacterium kimchii TaxID=2942909 RepID=A0ABY4N744_9MICO|nr:ATP-binding protein [Brachybacterium kimchii]UQN29225.1 ATP-binding protein [Brachybacterium kimchii]
MHEGIAHGLKPAELEWVCGGIIRDIATDLDECPADLPELMAPSHDGGIEAKVQTKSGYLAVQCKAYNDFASETRSIKSSFATFLDSPEHVTVNRYVWCSTARRTSGTGPPAGRKTGNDSKATDAIRSMHAAATAKQRKVTVTVLFADDLDRILRERRPEYFAVISAKSPLQRAAVDRHSKWQASQILSRLGSDSAPRIEFPIQQTATFLDRFIAASNAPRYVEGKEIGVMLNELEQRARCLHSDQPLCEKLAASVRTLTHEASHLTSQPVVASRDEALRVRTLQNHVQSTLNDAIDILEGATAAASEISSGDYQNWLYADEVKRCARSLIALLADVELINCMIDAVLSRTLLITGRWGTGKSFQLAMLTRRALAAGVPVLLLRGRDFTRPDAPILSQPWRNGLDNENAETAAVAAMLDAIGRRSNHPLFIIIDGLNESSIEDPAAALRHLQEMIQRFPNLRLILSSRRDRMEMADDSLPELVHKSPDRVTMARSVELALQARPGTRWHAALTNPLLASVAVLVLTADPGASDRLLSRTTLFDAWVELLAAEASAVLDVPVATIRRLIDNLAEVGGERSIIELSAETRLHSDRVDRIVQQLADDGFLELDSPARDTVRFRWDAMNDMLQMRHAIQAGRLDALLSARDEDRRFALSSLAAELAPKENPAHELPDLKLTSISAEESDVAFALSLGSRADGEITPRTRQLAERLLDSGGEMSEIIVRSVLDLPHRKMLGARWLNQFLRGTPLRRRARFWPQALESLSEASQFDQKNLESLLGWYVSNRWKSLTENGSESAVELLAWMGCAASGTGLPELAVCSLVEILHRDPSTLEPVLHRLRDVDDDHPHDALFTAAAGVAARWPESAAARTMRSVCSRALYCTPPSAVLSITSRDPHRNSIRATHARIPQPIVTAPKTTPLTATATAHRR